MAGRRNKQRPRNPLINMLKRNKLSKFLSKSSEAPFGISGAVIIVATVASTLALMAFMALQTEILREEFINVGFHNPKFFEDSRGIAGYNSNLGYSEPTSNYVTYELMRKTVFPFGALAVFVYIMFNAWGEATGLFGGNTKSMFFKFLGMLVLVIIFVPIWDILAVESEKFAINVLNPMYKHLPTDGTLPKTSSVTPYTEVNEDVVETDPDPNVTPGGIDRGRNTPSVIPDTPFDDTFLRNPTFATFAGFDETTDKTVLIQNDAKQIQKNAIKLLERVEPVIDEDAGTSTKTTTTTRDVVVMEVTDVGTGIVETTLTDKNDKVLKRIIVDDDTITTTTYDEDDASTQTIEDKDSGEFLETTKIKDGKTIVTIPFEDDKTLWTVTYDESTRKIESIEDKDGNIINQIVTEDGFSKESDTSYTTDRSGSEKIIRDIYREGENIIKTVIRQTGVITTTVLGDNGHSTTTIEHSNGRKIISNYDDKGEIVGTPFKQDVYPKGNCIDIKGDEILELVHRKNIQMYHQIKSDSWGFTGKSPCDPQLRIAYVYDKAYHGATADRENDNFDLGTVLADVNAWISNIVNTIFMGMTKTMILFILTISGMMIMTIRELLLAVIISLLPMFVLLAFVPKMAPIFGTLLQSIIPLLLVPVITAAVFFTGAGILHDMETDYANRCNTLPALVNGEWKDICPSTGEEVAHVTGGGSLTFWLASISLLVLATTVPLLMVPLMGGIASQATTMVTGAVLSGMMAAMSVIKGASSGAMAGGGGAMASQSGMGSVAGIKSMLSGGMRGASAGMGDAVSQDQQGGISTGPFRDASEGGKGGTGGTGGIPASIRTDAMRRGGGAKDTSVQSPVQTGTLPRTGDAGGGDGTKGGHGTTDTKGGHLPMGTTGTGSMGQPVQSTGGVSNNAMGSLLATINVQQANTIISSEPPIRLGKV